MTRMLDYVYVGIGAALGSLVRSVVEWSVRGVFPEIWAVLGINLIGAFLVGLLSALLLERFVAPDSLRLFLTVGVLGGFTTFGTLAAQATQLGQASQPALGLVILIGEIAMGILAAAFGQGVARRVFSRL